MVVDASWWTDLEQWLEPFLAGLSHPARRRMCPLYIAGLIGPGDRKSVQAIAARAGEVGYDQLHHFVAAGVWDSAPLEIALLKEADRLVGDEKGFLVIDDTALSEEGAALGRVAPQYASSLGKTSNCQSLVSVTLPGGEVWLVDERRSTGEQKYYLSNLPADTTLKTLAATIKARWICEQAHQQPKEELGLDHFEGRSWTGLHRHALMTMIAYAFLQSRRLGAAGRKNKSRRPAAATQHAGNQASHPRPIRTTSAPAMPPL